MFVIFIITILSTFLVIILSTVGYLISVLVEESDDDSSNPLLNGIDTHDFSLSPVVSPIDLNGAMAAAAAASSVGTAGGHQVNLEELRNSENLCNCVRGLLMDKRTGNSKQQVNSEAPVEQSATSSTTNMTIPKTTTTTTDVIESSAEADSRLLRDAALLAAAAAVPPRPEEIHSAEMNSRLLKTSASQQLLDQEAAAAAANNIKSTSTTNESLGVNSQWHSSVWAQKNLITSQLGAVASKQIFDDFDGKEMQLGGTALHWCKSRKSLDRLVKQPLNMPLEIVNRRHETALHVAIRRHKLQMLIGLLNYQANVECRNESGETALILAARVNDIFAVQLLLVFDADFNATDNLGHTARHYAATLCARQTSTSVGVGGVGGTPQLPSAAHLILAMLNEIGAQRCVGHQLISKSSDDDDDDDEEKNDVTATGSSSHQPHTTSSVCPEGCAPMGTYNGNSYDRWPSYARESLYKRHLFSDLVDERRRCVRSSVANKCACQLAADRAHAAPKSRLLCIDGGGLRGVIVCQIMIELEKYLKRPMISYFEWVGGTSVGAFIACALCRGTPLNDLRRTCFDVKDEVFSGGRPYNSKFLERVLKRTYGTSTRMSDVRQHKLAVTSVLADRDPCQLKFFRNYHSAGQILETHGFPHELYNCTSGHSIMTPAAASTAKRQTTATTTTTRRISGNNQQVIKSTLNNSEITSSTTSLADNETIESLNDTQIRSSSSLSGRKINQSESLAQIKSMKATLEQPLIESVAVLDENDHDPLMWQAVRASAAAPFFFKPYGPFLDGGIISNNPTLDMLNEFVSYQQVREFLRKHQKMSDKPLADMERSAALNSEQPSQLDLVVSLGTGRGRLIGRQAMADFGQIASGFSAVFSPVELVRSIKAARDLFKRLMQQSCHTDDHILDRAQAWCSSLGVPYFRVNPPLAAIFSIDDKRDEQLINALWQTKLYMRAMKGQLEELAELLDDPSYQTINEETTK